MTILDKPIFRMLLAIFKWQFIFHRMNLPHPPQQHQPQQQLPQSLQQQQQPPLQDQQPIRTSLTTTPGMSMQHLCKLKGGLKSATGQKFQRYNIHLFVKNQSELSKVTSSISLDS